MSDDLVPTVAVALSLTACGALPVLVLALSHGPARLAAPGRRFAAAAALTWLAWTAAMLAAAPAWVELVAGMLLLATATLIGFTAWTLIAWGFTLTLLRALARAGRPLPVEEWARTYTRGQSLDTFARDRIGVLLALGLAEVHGDRLAMTRRRGRVFARLTLALRRLFGLPQ